MSIFLVISSISVTMLYHSTVHDFCVMLVAPLTNLRGYNQPNRPKVSYHCEIWTFSIIYFMFG